jgi:hypothetical protein
MMNSLDQKYLEGFEMWCWRRMEKINSTGSVKNEKNYYILLRKRTISYIK